MSQLARLPTTTRSIVIFGHLDHMAKDIDDPTSPQPPLDGLQRIGPIWQSVPFPKVVASRFGLEPAVVEDPSPDFVIKSLAKLDQRADSWPNIHNLEYRLSKPCHPRTVEILGLDHATRQMRLRAVLAVAWRDSWQVANIFFDMRELEKCEAKYRKPLDNFLEKHPEVLRLAGKYLELYKDPSSKDSSNVGQALDGLLEFREEARIRLGYIKALRSSLPDAFPQRFLTARISEIYAIFSGKSPTFHHSKKETKDGSAPDTVFGEFLTDARIAIGHPTPSSALDARLRELRRSGRNMKMTFKSLADIASRENPIVGGRRTGLDFSRFPTAGALTDLVMAVSPTNATNGPLPAFLDELI